MVAAPARKRILLVDDEVIIAMAEKRVLASADYDTETALSGMEAIKKAQSSPFDLVLMDIDLGPGIDGGEAARRIRRADGPPVVFLSSHSEESAVAKTKDAGGYGFIMKGSGDRILKASVKMALELSMALKGLAESEARWASLARNAADYIITIGPDRRILFSNRVLGGEGGLAPGASFLSFCAPGEREAVDRAIGLAFAEKLFTRLFLRSVEAAGPPKAYEVLFGPAGSPGKVEYLTAVLREQLTLDLAPPAAASPSEEAEILAAVSTIDFKSFQGLLEGFSAATGLQASIVARDDRFLAATPFSRACAAFHRASPSSLAACDAAGRTAQVARPAEGSSYMEYRCPNGLRDLAIPLETSGLRWGTLFAGQFIYEDELDEGSFERRAEEFGWDPAEYLGAIREVPRVSRDRMRSYIGFFESLASVLGSVAAAARRERASRAALPPASG
jgi:CheY-like chemotaxis protein/ligand-binding sensor protein